VSIERVFSCDGPECGAHVRTGLSRPSVPGFLIVTETGNGTRHFCCWDCAIKFGARFPPPEIIMCDEPAEAEES
jgi:hypothetical protein